MKSPFFVTIIKPLFIIFIFAFGGIYSSTAVASLSTKKAIPNKIIASKAERLSQHSISKKLPKNSPRLEQPSNSVSRINYVYRNWAGTRYRMGGTTKAGIDCSAFVREVMDKAFNKYVPRTTAEQRSLGRSISKSDLRPGDLVFFRKNNHVGVYIGHGKFVHASSSRGVTTSSLSESYWLRTYTQSRRII